MLSNASEVLRKVMERLVVDWWQGTKDFSQLQQTCTRVCQTRGGNNRLIQFCKKVISEHKSVQSSCIFNKIQTLEISQIGQKSAEKTIMHLGVKLEHLTAGRMTKQMPRSLEDDS